MKRCWNLIIAALVALILAYAAPSVSGATPLFTPTTPAQETFLDEVAQKTWAYISSDWATDNHLPWSWRSTTDSTNGNYANPAEIGLYMLSNVAANQLGESGADADTVKTEIEFVLDQLRAWQTGAQTSQPNGANAYQNSVFYQWYWIGWNPAVVGAGSGDHVVPSIDNAILAACLMTIRQWAKSNTLTAVQDKVDAMLDDMNFMLWYNSTTHRFKLGAPENPLGGVDADYYSNENRLINFVARALGQLSPAEYRASMNALVQQPATYIAPSGTFTVEKVAWDGSLFTYLVPNLFIREMETDYGTGTIEPAVQAQIAFANDKGYEAWGFSDTFDIGEGGYIQSGALPVAMPLPSNVLEVNPGVVTPHASALALNTTLAGEAATNLQTLSAFSSLYDAQYGFKDSVMVKTDDADYGVASNRFSALAQSYILLAIAQHKTNFIWEYFYGYKDDKEVIAAHNEIYCHQGPANAANAAVDNLDHVAADWGIFCDASVPHWSMSNVATPSLDGEALDCAITGGDDYGKVHCYRNLLSEPNAASFSADFSFQFSPATTCNNAVNPSVIQGIEFTMNKWYQGNRYEFAVQWENVDAFLNDTAPQWRYWDGTQWKAFAPVIPECLVDGVWHTLRLEGAIVNNQVDYRSFTIDGIEHILTLPLLSPTPSSDPAHLAVALQLDANFNADPYHVYLDKVSFVRWQGLLTPLAPANEVIVNSPQPTISWGALQGATHYELQLGLNNPPQAIVYDGAGRNYIPCSSLTEGFWYWRVRGVDAAGHRSPWTKMQRFLVKFLSIAPPTRNYFTTSTPTLTWNRVTAAISYEVQVNDISGFTPELSLTTPALADSLYCWRVRALDANGTWGAWSAMEGFIVDTP